jgi:hypothetical protein
MGVGTHFYAEKDDRTHVYPLTDKKLNRLKDNFISFIRLEIRAAAPVGALMPAEDPVLRTARVMIVLPAEELLWL